MTWLLLSLFLLSSPMWCLAAIYPNNYAAEYQGYLESKVSSVWGPHIQDFMELIDFQKLLMVFLNHLEDPELLNFLGFVLDPKFKELIYEFESMDEFKEAYMFLQSKGYDVESVIDWLNSALELPPFEKPLATFRTSRKLSDLFEDLKEALPIEEMQKLFEQKLQESPEIAELFETINSNEFLDILKRMSQNPKYIEMKKILESYGFDFKYLCGLAKEIFGKYYQGVLRV